MDSRDQGPVDMETKFYHQAHLFRELGKKMEKYMDAIDVTKDAMTGVHEATLAFCDSDWPRFQEFVSLLEDQVELWTLLSQDIVRLGSSYQTFADKFHQVLTARKQVTEVQGELNAIMQQVKRINASKAAGQEEKKRVKSSMRQKQIDFHRVTDAFKAKLTDLEKSQNEFIVNHYKSFVEAHTLFCKESLEVHDLVLQSMARFLKNKRPALE